MKLGTETNSLMNHIYSKVSSPEPEAGMGATILFWTDRKAGTIILSQDKLVSVQLDKATRVDQNGISEEQEYTYERNPLGRIYHFKKNREGVYKEVSLNDETGRWKATKSGIGILIGARKEYYDFNL